MKKLAIFLIALFCAGAFAQDLPRIAVYVTGDVPDNEKKALGTRMLATLINSKRYKGIERSNSFLAEVEKEQVKQRSGEIDDSQIRELGKQFGVQFVCIADITPAYGSFQVSARIVNVETAEVDFIGDATSPLKTIDDLTLVSGQVVNNMFGGQITPKPKPEPKLEPTPEPAAVIHTEPEPPKIEPKPEPEPANLASQENIETVKTEPKSEPKEKIESKYRRLQKKIGIEAGGIILPYSYCEYSGYGEVDGWGSDHDINELSFRSGSDSGFGGGGYLYLDLIYVEIYGEFVGLRHDDIFGGGGIVAKYPIVYKFVKVFPLFGLGTIIGNGAGSINVTGNPLILGGGTDIGISEIAYIRSEYRYGAFGSDGSAMSFTIGGGLDIGLGEQKKTYLRTELLYNWIEGTEEFSVSGLGLPDNKVSRYSMELRAGIGYKLGGSKKPKEPRPPRTAELNDVEEF